MPVALTMGDPAGIGPEIVVKALQLAAQKGLQGPFLVYGCPAWLSEIAGRHGADKRLLEVVPCCSVPLDLAVGEVSAIAGAAR